ncbi:MAG: sugar ABC transporter permease [Alphaproteobacteria bacterium]|nr:sugar ABC transporter permease [Alphaproteobacteria bacterium]MBN9499499.1 sugar ABC transporter permease [Alphaproteobacteria bacterium]
MASRRATHDTLWRRIALTPTILVFLAMSILPTLNLMAMSVNEITWVDGKAVWSYVGFTHYARLAEDTLLIAGLKNTAIFAIVGVAIQVLLGFLLAWAVSRIARGRVLYRTIFILPILVPGILIGAVWKLMLNYDFGLVNGFIGVFGFHPVDWLGTRAWALPSVIMVDIWHWTPFCFLLLLAGFESLPQDVQEAARVDGAGTWAEMRYVLIPMMMPVIAVTFLFRLVTSLKVFDEIYLLTGGGPGSATEVISYTIYRTFFTQDRMGYGSAMSVAVLFFISLTMIGVLMAGRRGRNAT